MKNLDLEFFLFLHKVIAPKRLKIDISDFSMNLQDHQEQHLSKKNYKVVVLELFGQKGPRKGSKWGFLKAQPSKLYNKYMITLTQIRNTEIFAFIVVPNFMLLGHKILFINRKDYRIC